MDKLKRIDKILVRYFGDATVWDMDVKTNRYLVSELLQCNMEDSSLLAIIQSFLYGEETLGHIYDILESHYNIGGGR